MHAHFTAARFLALAASRLRTAATAFPEASCKTQAITRNDWLKTKTPPARPWTGDYTDAKPVVPTSKHPMLRGRDRVSAGVPRSADRRER